MWSELSYIYTFFSYVFRFFLSRFGAFAEALVCVISCRSMCVYRSPPPPSVPHLQLCSILERSVEQVQPHPQTEPEVHLRPITSQGARHSPGMISDLTQNNLIRRHSLFRTIVAFPNPRMVLSLTSIQ